MPCLAKFYFGGVEADKAQHGGNMRSQVEIGSEGESERPESFFEISDTIFRPTAQE